MTAGTFGFGPNWRRYLDNHVDDTVLDRAGQALARHLDLESLKGRRVLDIGCGSGIHSLAALRLGAESVTSLDVDPDSVACCRDLKTRHAPKADWTVLEASILTTADMDHLGTFDIVYSFGVLHHTGDLDLALDNAFARVAPGGRAFIGIYNTVERWWNGHQDGRFGTSAFWARVKILYNRLPSPLQTLLCALFVPAFALASCLQGRWPWAAARELKEDRGMHWWIDVRDWVGGWPYETLTADEFRRRAARAGLSPLQETLFTDLRNNLFLYERSSSL